MQQVEKPRLCQLLMAVGLILLTVPANAAPAEKLDGDRLLDPTRLLEIRIKLNDADWTQLRGQARNPSAFFSGGDFDNPFTYFKADLWIGDVKIESVGVRKKGLFGSQDMRRPSLKIKFDEFVRQDPVKGLSRLTLNNNKQDTSLVSQYLTYKLFRDAGIHAPRSGFAKVTVNGEYLGIYTNVESVKKPFLEKSFGNKTGKLYEGTLTDFHPRTVEKLEAKGADANKDRSTLVQLAKLLASDAEWSVGELEKIVDVDNFMRYWATEGMIRFWDGYASNQNNYFLYENPENGLGYFIPWGADGSFTRQGGPFGFGRQGTTAVYAQSLLANRLYHTKGIPERYRTTMLSLLDEVWNEKTMLAEVDRVEQLVSADLPASQRGAMRAMEDVREFIRTRREVLKGELSNWPAEVPSEPRKPSYTVAVGTMKGSFSTRFTAGPNAEHGTPNAEPAAGATGIEVEIENKPVEFTSFVVRAQTFQIPRFGRGGPGRFGGFGGGPGPAADPPARISLILTGERKSDRQRVTAALIIDQKEFEKSTGDSISVTGSLSEGQARGFGGFGGFGGGPNRSVNGQLKLTKVGTSPGDVVAGELDLKITEVHGGFFAQRRPPQGGQRGGFGGPRGGGGPGGGGPGFGGRGNGAPGPGSPRPTRPQRPATEDQDISAIQTVIDRNGDGKLSASEIKEAAAALKKLDRNRDGEISGDELKTPAPPADDRNETSETPQSEPSEQSNLVKFTTQEDHRNMLQQLGITKLRPGPSGNATAPNAANYEEAQANPYPEWPGILVLSNGERVTSPEVWREKRRPELVELFEREVYGRIPQNVPAVKWTEKETRDGMAGEIPVTEQHIVGKVDNTACPEINVEISMSLTLPKKSTGPVPVLMMFGMTPFDPMPAWMQRFNRNRGGGARGGDARAARPPSPTDELIAAGWGFVKINPSSIQADKGDGLTRGIIGLTNLGQPRKPDDWGSLRAWGWGASRGLDYLQTRSEVNSKHVGIEGVSRYGKAALVTMAFDERFGMVLVGSSGAGGATPHRRNFGEAVENLAGSGEYHWMAGNFLKYAASESKFGSKNASDLPVDSHQLIALCAPRLTFISYGIPEKGDANWLDQRGSFMATVAAGNVFELLGAKSLGITEDFRKAALPAVNHGLVDGSLAWRQHDGGHTDAPNITHFIKWSEQHFAH